MQIVYTHEEPPQSFSKSIFLAGPTPRAKEVKSWRPEALELLKTKGYDGVVFVPEDRDSNFDEFDTGYDYEKTPNWEHRMMDMADIVLFWVPRNLDTMPAFTTNVEFGLQAHLGKIVLGAPIEAPKNKYLQFVAKKFNIYPGYYTLNGTINAALDLISEGSLREGGEREIPLFLWNTPSFQIWYQSHKKSGNRLDGAKVYWTFKVGKNKDKVFYWAIHPNIHISSENRNKTNECVLSRFDISSVVLYRRGLDIFESEIVLVKEFRSPVRNTSGFVWELPGGSSPVSADPLETIVDETLEEVGLKIDKSRFVPVISRQLAATMSAHHGMLYSVELNDDELAWLKSQKDIPHGSDYPDNPTGERAYTEVVKLKDIRYNNLVDWGNMGMILSVLSQEGEKQ